MEPYSVQGTVVIDSNKDIEDELTRSVGNREEVMVDIGYGQMVGSNDVLGVTFSGSYETKENCPTGDCNPWTATKAAVAVAVTTSVADGPLLIGDAIGIEAVIGAIASNLYKQQREGVQYSLRANRSGLYPVYTWGSSVPTSTQYLKAGDIWKIGETTQCDKTTGKQKRYSFVYLKSMNVEFVQEYTELKQR